MTSLRDIEKKLIEYRETLNCKYPFSIFEEENYKNLDKKDLKMLILFETIYAYLEDEKAKDSGWED